jgi:hypothetical protein
VRSVVLCNGGHAPMIPFATPGVGAVIISTVGGCFH